MDPSERYRKEQDLIFQEIEERELLARQTDAATTEDNKLDWFRQEVMKQFLRKKFFRAMPPKEQQEFVTDSIRRWKQRNNSK